MAFLGLILLVALLIPIMGIVIDSPIGRALARAGWRARRPFPPPSPTLAKKVEVLEGELEELQRSVTALQEENQFLQRLLEDQSAHRPALPPPKQP